MTAVITDDFTGTTLIAKLPFHGDMGMYRDDVRKVEGSLWVRLEDFERMDRHRYKREIFAMIYTPGYEGHIPSFPEWLKAMREQR